MGKIFDIYALWNFGEGFEDDNGFAGRFILGDKDVFEGVIYDNYLGSAFIFGKFTENSITVNVNFSNLEIPPFIYEAKKDEDEYCGEIYTLDNFFEKTVLGHTFINVLAPSEKDNLAQEIQDVQSEIDLWKSVYMNEYSELLYLDFLSDVENSKEGKSK